MVDVQDVCSRINSGWYSRMSWSNWSKKFFPASLKSTTSTPVKTPNPVISTVPAPIITPTEHEKIETKLNALTAKVNTMTKKINALTQPITSPTEMLQTNQLLATNQKLQASSQITAPTPTSIPVGGKRQKGGYRATKKDKAALKKLKQGKSIGFTMRSSLKAKGLLRRSNGTMRVSAKYKKN